MKKYRYKKAFKAKKKKSIFRNRFFWFGVLFIILLGAVFYFVVFSPYLQIENIEISGNQKVAAESLKNIIRDKINRKIIFFETKSILLTNLKGISEEILKKFPQIGEVNLKRRFPNQIIVGIKERISLGIWCKGENCFYFDREGIIFEKGKEDGIGLLIRNELLRSETLLGEKVIEKECLDSILKIKKGLKENFQIEIKEFFVLEEERLNLKTQEGWEVYFNLGGDIDWQIIELNLILKQRIPPEKRKNIEYIDLRFEKVYIFPETYRE